MGEIRPPKFRIIMGRGSLSFFDALVTNEVAGLRREDAQKFIDDLHQQGKIEVDGAFIAGLTNIHDKSDFLSFLILKEWGTLPVMPPEFWPMSHFICRDFSSRQ